MKTLAEMTTTTAESSDLERKERESRSLALEKAYVHGNHFNVANHTREVNKKVRYCTILQSHFSFGWMDYRCLRPAVASFLRGALPAMASCTPVPRTARTRISRLRCGYYLFSYCAVATIQIDV